MAKVLILGANGQIARAATELFLGRTDARLTLYLHNARRLNLSGHNDRGIDPLLHRARDLRQRRL